MSIPEPRPFNVTRFKFWIDPLYERLLLAEKSINYSTFAMDAADQDLWTALQTTHILQTTSDRNELPKNLTTDGDFLARCPNLVAVSVNGSGCDTVDLEACTKAGVMVVNQAGGNANSVAEMTLGLILSVQRRIAESDRLLRSKDRGFRREDLMGRELRGLTIGLVGMSAIGSRTAELSKAFGMTVLGSDPSLSAQELASRGAESVTLEELLQRSDIVSLHCPLNSRTAGMMNAKSFSSMKQGAIFISTARSGIHDEAALAAALRCGHLAGAGLDVWTQEPPPCSHELLSLPNVVATYHTAGVTHEGRRNNAELAATQIIKLLATLQQPERLVNRDVWPHALRRMEKTFNLAKFQMTDR